MNPLSKQHNVIVVGMGAMGARVVRQKFRSGIKRDMNRSTARPLYGWTARVTPLIALVLLTISCAPAPVAQPSNLPVTQSPNPSPVTHVIVIGLDNYHIDDIQAKMPNLWGFLQKGAYTTNTHHPNLPSRTAPGFASIASGQYPDHHGVPNNSFLVPQPRAGFAYWENITKRTPPTFTSVPPWVAFNQAGWDVGAIGWQGLVIENKEEASAYLSRDAGGALDQYWGIAIHRKDGKAEIGTAEIPVLRAQFPDGWKNGWDGPPRKHAPITLPMAITMLQSGVPILFVYVENTHGRCSAAPPCESNLANGTFDDLVQADDAAFGKFISDLDKMGISPANTLFVVLTDEGDHYLANYAQVIDTTDLQPSISGAAGIFYGSDADAIGATLASRKGVQAIATREAIKALHIASGADSRTPTMIAFTDADYIFNRGPCSTCVRWNHGTIHPDITDSWLALVGPGIQRGKMDSFSDHTDIVPTIRLLLGMPPSSDVDGVPIYAALDRATSDDLVQLREVFKQLYAPLGKFARAILKISTQGVVRGPTARVQTDAQIRDLAAKRDALVAEMRPAIDGTQPLSHDQIAELLKQAQALMEQAGAVN